MPESPPPTDSPEQPLLQAAQVEDVFAATEEVRAADFPNVPAQLLADVLAAERDNPDNRTAAARAVARAIDAYLLDTPVSGPEPPGQATGGGSAA